ncbi:hypothetical protein BESB_014770 [Besnoitia besnoiti]|uniref:Uncharacterized protein n=1 Tax=Besnoitia besnoiti TaxID=94643 RepID=A0A2A9M6Q2_BESBE|nr:hypothetical protein BESB_014770 [Besnoitia besnoiti]PFH32864.1 hypothetical protein BESB_014770 [Besnoitia besnoiti]
MQLPALVWQLRLTSFLLLFLSRAAKSLCLVSGAGRCPLSASASVSPSPRRPRPRAVSVLSCASSLAFRSSLPSLSVSPSAGWRSAFCVPLSRKPGGAQRKGLFDSCSSRVRLSRPSPRPSFALASRGVRPPSQASRRLLGSSLFASLGAGAETSPSLSAGCPPLRAPPPPAASPVARLGSDLADGTVAIPRPLEAAALEACSSVLLATDLGTQKMGMALFSLTSAAGDRSLVSSRRVAPSRRAADAAASSFSAASSPSYAARPPHSGRHCPPLREREAAEASAGSGGLRERAGEAPELAATGSETAELRRHPHSAFVEAEREAARREREVRRRSAERDRRKLRDLSGVARYLTLSRLADGEDAVREKKGMEEATSDYALPPERGLEDALDSPCRQLLPLSPQALNSFSFFSSPSSDSSFSPSSSSPSSPLSAAPPSPSFASLASQPAVSLLRRFTHGGDIEAAVARVCGAVAAYGVRALLVGYPKNPFLHPSHAALTFRSLLCRDFAVLLARAVLRQAPHLAPSSPLAATRSTAASPVVFLHDEARTTLEAKKIGKGDQRPKTAEFLDSRSAAVLGRVFLSARGAGSVLVLPDARTFFPLSFVSARRPLSQFKEFYRVHPAVVELAKTVPWGLLL